MGQGGHICASWLLFCCYPWSLALSSTEKISESEHHICHKDSREHGPSFCLEHWEALGLFLGPRTTFPAKGTLW